MKKLLSIVLCLGLGFGFTSCKDDEKDSDEQKAPVKVMIPKIETSISANHTDDNARSLKSTIESLNYMSGMFLNFYEGFDGFQWVKNGNTYTWQQTAGSEAIKYVVTDNGASYLVQFYITGNMGSYQVANALLFEGSYTKDGKSGNWKMYEFTSSTASFIDISYEWTTTSAGVLTGRMKMWDSATDTLPDSYEVAINSDKSGAAIFKENDIKVWSALWNKNGSGEETYFNSSGEIISTVNWGPNP